MGSHSIIPPSSAGVWGAKGGCRASVLMTQMYPDDSQSIDSMEGDAVHELCANILLATSKGGKFKHHEELKMTNGVVLTDEMIDAANIYCDEVIGTMRNTGVFGESCLGIEKRLEMPNIHAVSFGTCDCFIFDKKTMKLYVYDFKYGHVKVEAFENWQMINYAEGVINLLEINGYDEQHIEVEFVIIQPRAFHRDGVIRKWVTRLSLLRAYINILHSSAIEALSNDAKCNTGTHCKYCSARINCDAALTAGVGLYEVANNPTPVDMSNHAIGVHLSIIKRAIEQLTCLETAFDEVVKTTVKQGGVVPGWIIVSTTGRKKWKSTVTDSDDIRLIKPNSLITPNQAIKLGVNEDWVKANSYTPNTGIKIVNDNGLMARKNFGE